MRVKRAAVVIAAGAGCLGLLSSACGSDRPSSPVDGGTSGGSATGASANGTTAGQPNLGNLGGTNTGVPGIHDPTTECAGQLVEAKPVPLDMYVMLDVSGSMLDVTIGNPQLTKWTAVSSALIDFVNDPESAGLGVGLQVFPLPHTQAPAECASNAACGEFGPCYMKVCWPPPEAAPRRCESDNECGGTRLNPRACIPFGVCANDDMYICPTIGDECGLEDGTLRDLGPCRAEPTRCMNVDDCRAASYAMPAAPIAELPGASAALVNVIEQARPNGATPSGPALTGAIQAASAWASDHVEHQVVAVLATDGQPNLTPGAPGALACAPIDEVGELEAIFDVAAAGRAASPSIATFVIGVLGPDDVSAPIIMDSIALAGGTEQAFLVDTAGNVNQQFRDALNQIRAGRLSCELLLPEPEAGKKLDFHAINVQYDSGSGPETLDNFASAADCPTTGGWHYDVDPDTGGIPTRIVACPATCAAFGQVAVGSVAIKLGCVTKTPVK